MEEIYFDNGNGASSGEFPFSRLSSKIEGFNIQFQMYDAS
ncbi:MAG: hypothetical protein ACJAWV_002815 [Flammeovirgaceae bacterium]|jgi:hypothetical protein